MRRAIAADKQSHLASGSADVRCQQHDGATPTRCTPEVMARVAFAGPKHLERTDRGTAGAVERNVSRTGSFVRLRCALGLGFDDHSGVRGAGLSPPRGRASPAGREEAGKGLGRRRPPTWRGVERCGYSRHSGWAPAADVCGPQDPACSACGPPSGAVSAAPGCVRLLGPGPGPRSLAGRLALPHGWPPLFPTERPEPRAGASHSYGRTHCLSTAVSYLSAKQASQATYRHATRGGDGRWTRCPGVPSAQGTRGAAP